MAKQLNENPWQSTITQIPDRSATSFTNCLRATGVLVLFDGHIMGGDTHFYYTGTTPSKTANGAAS
jgi:hypothetical protein